MGAAVTVERLKENLDSVRQAMADVAVRGGRAPDSVRMVGVTKYVDAELTGALVSAGCFELGESRPQSMWGKHSELNDPRIHWHLIGHLQRNKIKRVVEIASLIHSADSVRLLEAINAAAAARDRVTRVLLEVNVSEDAAKHGFRKSELAGVIERVGPLSHVQVDGLMAMAGRASGLDGARREFASLRELADSHRENVPDNVRMDELSMGMSSDFEIAIEEGATLVRVGSLLFEGVR